MTYNVFLSVGGQATNEQYEFVQKFEKFMRDHKMEPLKAEPTIDSPYDNINETMRRSDGVIVLALERFVANELIENRNGTRSQRRQKNHGEAVLPTVWNQIEAAFACAWEKPLMVICERGLRQEGLLEPIGKYYVHSVDLSDTDLADLRIAMSALQDRMDGSKRSIQKSWKRMSDASRVGLLGTFIGSLIAIAGIAFGAGKFFSG